MSATAHTIRDFTDPPVIETVLSFQFAPITGFSVPHFGLYWRKIRNEFKRTAIHPPIGSVREDFTPGRMTGIPQIGIELVTEPNVRCWFIDEKGNQLIQVQNDRFIHNWQKVSGDEVYPRYESVRSKFEQEWQRFCAFLKEENLAIPEVNQCEVTYVNHIEYEKGWKSFGELNKVITCWSGSHSGTFLPAPEKVNLNVSYVLPNNRGRLHISLQPVIRARDAKEVLQLNLTARGAPASSETAEIFRWLDIGRQWVVEGFTDFTTKEMHKLWGRTK